MTVVAQTTLQPETIGVIAVLAVALLALVVVAITLVRSRRRHRREQDRLRADTPDPSRFAGQVLADVVTAADAALYERDGRTAAAAALRLHAEDHREALPYLLHALRLAPAHQREPLVRAAATHGPDELARHPLLAAALDPLVLTSLRDAVQQAERASSTPARRGQHA